MKKTRRLLIGAAVFFALLLVMVLGKPVFYLSRAVWRDRVDTEFLPTGFMDDASRMNRTRVAEVRDIPIDPDAAEEQLRSLIRRAKAEKLKISIAGARHSMGGHTIAPDGVVLNMLPFNRMSLDEGAGVLTVGAGARWSEVIPFLDARGRSVAVMQSNDSFSVGGSLSVNCHGWQHDRPPLVSTIESFRLMTADGEVLRCSRGENAELFSLVTGGYGLFGVVLDVRLRVVPNERYRVARAVFPSDRYEAEFDARVAKSSDAAMAFGRLCIVPGKDTFLREAILTSFHRDPAKDGKVPPLAPITDAALTRAFYRSSIGSDYGKSLRWSAEKNIGEAVYGKYFSRNQLLHNGVERLQDRSAERADILHEYFIPRGRVEGFLARLRVLIPRSDADLLNVTVRTVRRDDETVLRYADRDMFCFVMLFSQPRTPGTDSRMEAMTREIIEASLSLGGTYYLPYRLHATRDQFLRAYPEAPRFFDGKRKYDPAGLFQNQFSLRYGPP
jgi:FAD/FMN-containing dehydrogenase